MIYPVLFVRVLTPQGLGVKAGVVFHKVRHKKVTVIIAGIATTGSPVAAVQQLPPKMTRASAGC